jgi:ubiquitin C-terminal hydrolase
MDCLRAFTEKELLDGQEQVYCSKCKTHRDSWKQLTIHKLPKVLVIRMHFFQAFTYKFRLEAVLFQIFIQREDTHYSEVSLHEFESE